jgi:putative sterol carrier protein
MTNDKNPGAEGETDTDSQDNESEAPRPPRTRPTSAKDLILEHVPDRAKYASSHLRVELTGSVLVKIKDSKDKFLFDWRGDKAKTEQTQSDEAECTISVSESDLMKIANGDLNPQVSMLSEKVKVAGKSSLAIYFFNLVAP